MTRPVSTMMVSVGVFLACCSSTLLAQVWELQSPTELETVPAPPGVRKPLHAMPSGFVWLEDVPYLVVAKGQKSSTPTVEAWRGGKKWQRVTLARSGLSWPVTVSLPGHVGIIASEGKNTRGGYGNRIVCLRWKPGGRLADSVTIAQPSSPTERITVSGAVSRGHSVTVFLLREPSGATENELLFARSRDGGVSFGAPVSMGKTSMHEDGSRLGCLQWSDRELARFVVERRKGVWLYRTSDGGASWKRHEVELSDELGATAERSPLAVVQGDDWAGMAYLAAAGRTGRYFYARSIDAGRTWGKGVAITADVKVDDPSMFVKLGAAGDRLAFSFLEVRGSWSRGEFSSRLLLSSDRGASWAEAGGVKLDGLSLFSALTASPAGDRFLYATATWPGEPDDLGNLLRVYEVKPRR